MIIKWEKVLATLWKIDRIALVIYLVALTCLLTIPIGGAEFHLLGIRSDKWMHVALFGGLAFLLRWNLSEQQGPLYASVGVALLVVVATEIGQGLLVHRSAEILDLVAGSFGAVLGAMIADCIMISRAVHRLLGVLVVVLGSMLMTLFLFADAIGVGDGSQFGITQLVGMTLGGMIATGGVKVYLGALRSTWRRG